MANLLKQVLICSAAIFAVTQASFEARIWSYAEAADWGKYYPHCNGQNQSPIDIVTSGSTLDETKKVEFDWVRKNTKMQTVTTNTGYTVTFTSEEMEDKITINNEDYRLHKILYHWGSDATKGSEHSINKEFYSGEAQFIHFKLSYGTYKKAKKTDDGLAIVSILLKEDPTLVDDNLVFKGFQNILKNVIEPKVSYNLEFVTKTIQTKDLIPEDKKYFVYSGSLTTPPCTENVLWVVFKTPLSVTKGYLQSLRALKKTQDKNIADNFRPVQYLGERQIYESEENIDKSDC